MWVLVVWAVPGGHEDVRGWCYCQRPGKHPYPVLTQEVTLVSMVQIAA